jgi:NTP pyrophosphatase (non-canonical NTP hydrolase)
MREMERQNEKWGEQNHPMHNDHLLYDCMRSRAKLYKKINDNDSPHSWFFILMEEVYEAFAETKPKKQREEIIQVAAVAIQIAECLERKKEDKKK